LKIGGYVARGTCDMGVSCSKIGQFWKKKNSSRAYLEFPFHFRAEKKILEIFLANFEIEILKLP